MRDPVGVEASGFLRVVEFPWNGSLPTPNELDRDIDLAIDCDHHSALRRTVELGQELGFHRSDPAFRDRISSRASSTTG